MPVEPEQLAWIEGYVQLFHDKLHKEPMGDIAAYADIGSFVDLFIINEISMDVDAYIRSAYYYKDRDGLLTAGPAWDYNFSLGGILPFQSTFPPWPGRDTDSEDVDTDTGEPPMESYEGWQWEVGRKGTNDWYILLGEDPGFMAQVSTRWWELRQGLLSTEQINARIDRLTAPLTNAAVRDFEIWKVDEISGGMLTIPTEPTWEGQVEVMRDWIHQRLAWIDSKL